MNLFSIKYENSGEPGLGSGGMASSVQRQVTTTTVISHQQHCSYGHPQAAMLRLSRTCRYRLLALKNSPEFAVKTIAETHYKAACKEASALSTAFDCNIARVVRLRDSFLSPSGDSHLVLE